MEMQRDERREVSCEAFQRGAAQEPETGTERRKPARPKGKRSKVGGEEDEVAPEPTESWQVQRQCLRDVTARMRRSALGPRSPLPSRRAQVA